MAQRLTPQIPAAGLPDGLVLQLDLPVPPHIGHNGTTLVAGELLHQNGEHWLVGLGAASGLEAVRHRWPCSRFAVAALPAPALQMAGAHQPQLLVQASVPTLAHWRRNREQLLDALADQLGWWLQASAGRGDLMQVGTPAPVNLRQAPEAPFAPRLLCQSRWLAAGLARRCRQALSGADNRHWQIAIARLAGGRAVDVEVLPSRSQHWFADPFLVEAEGCRWLFCEGVKEGGRGVIEAFRLEAEGPRPMGAVLQEPFHLSFPRLFRWQGRWYGTVESGAHGDVRLYELTDFPHGWRLRRVLLEGAAWADPMLVQRGDHWFLLVSSSCGAALPRELSPLRQLFHSPDLLHAPFVAHPRSPLALACDGGRNGGLIETAGQLLRVGQCSGFGGGYGRTVTIQRITRLDACRYGESTASLPWLAALRQQLGASHLHTINGCGEWVVVDFMRR